ncbi:MAG: hypothetical protein ACOC37_03450 [Spirochaetota bacterium]
MVQSDFDQAWTDGARTWRERSAADEAELFITSEAWETYRPVGFSEGTSDISLPRKEELVTEMQSSIDDRVERRGTVLPSLSTRRPLTGSRVVWDNNE